MGKAGDELSIPECLLKSRGVCRSVRDFQIDLHIDVHCSSVLMHAVGTQQFRHQTSENDELRSIPVVVDDADKRTFCCLPCCAGTERWVSRRGSFPVDVRRLPHLVHPRF